jgi:protein-tyrosine phosphatase
LVFSGGPFWIDAGEGVRLATMPRPDGDDLSRLKNARVDVLVSLLEPFEALTLGLARAEQSCALHGIELVRFPIRDHSVPRSPAATLELARALSAKLDQGKSVAIHCYAGIGRSSLIAATVLGVRGFEVTEAFERISKARGIVVPDTVEQLEWLRLLLSRSDNPRREP